MLMGVPVADFRIINHGTICILQALTEVAENWVSEYLPADATTWGQNGIVVEPRYVDPIIDGIVADGLEVAHG